MTQPAKDLSELQAAYDTAFDLVLVRAGEFDQARLAEPEAGTFEAVERLRPRAAALNQAVNAWRATYADIYEAGDSY